jgi:tetratricopeptide (TPR) repeat protein
MGAMIATSGERLGSIGERLAAVARDRSASLSRRAARVAAAVEELLRVLWTGAAVVVLLLGMAVVAALLWRGLVGVPSARELQLLRDYMLLVLEAVVLLAALGLLAVVILWLFHTDPAVISPFTNATSIGSLTAVSDLLVGHLDRIGTVQNTRIPDIPGERLRSSPVQPKPETIDSSLANVGSINLGQASISVGQLLIALKRMLPVRGRGTTISGSVQQYGKTIQLVATVQRGRLMNTVMTHGELDGDDVPIPTLVPELAYRIHFALAGTRMEARTWEMLRCFTEARAAYQRYASGRQAADRDTAMTLTSQAYATDPTYPRLFGLFYGLGTCFFGSGEIPAAVDMFQTALTVEPGCAQALVQLARCNYALGRDDDARGQLARALGQARCRPVALYLMGVVNGTAGRPKQAIEDLSRVPRRPPSLRSSAWVTIAGLRLQGGDEPGHSHALRHVARRDFDADAYARACWLSVTGAADAAAAALRDAFRRQLVPIEYALRHPDLRLLREHFDLRELGDMARRPVALRIPSGAGAPNPEPVAAGG